MLHSAFPPHHDDKKTFRKNKKFQKLRTLERGKQCVSGLVSEVIGDTSEEMLAKKECGVLQKLCARAEYELEKYWALKIAGKAKRVEDFPYYENYAKLTLLEKNTLAFCQKHSKHKIIFVGGGPLPMTAIIFAIEHGIKLTVIDNNYEAVRLSRSVVKTLNLEKMITVYRADGGFFRGYRDFNVIFVAALAGVNPKDKEKIFRNIKIRAGKDAHIIARSSVGRRIMIYPSLEKNILNA